MKISKSIIVFKTKQSSSKFGNQCFSQNIFSASHFFVLLSFKQCLSFTSFSSSSLDIFYTKSYTVQYILGLCFRCFLVQFAFWLTVHLRLIANILLCVINLILNIEFHNTDRHLTKTTQIDIYIYTHIIPSHFFPWFSNSVRIIFTTCCVCSNDVFSLLSFLILAQCNNTVHRWTFLSQPNQKRVCSQKRALALQERSAWWHLHNNLWIQYTWGNGNFEDNRSPAL